MALEVSLTKPGADDDQPMTAWAGSDVTPILPSLIRSSLIDI